MRFLLKALLFLSSYSPLLAVFALLDTFGKGWPSVVFGVLSGLGVASTTLIFLIDRSTNPQPLHVASASPRDADILAYVASYLIPFATINASTGRQQIAVAIFILLIAVVYIRTDMVYVNPLLALVGYRLFQVETTGGTTVALICRRRFIARSSEVSAVRLSEYVWREKRDGW